MAWIAAKGTGFLVRWRDEYGKTRSKYAADRAKAERLKAIIEENESMARILQSLPPGIGRLSGPLRRKSLPGRHVRSLAWYLRMVIESDTELRQASRETYLAGLKNHIDGTPLGETDIRAVTPDAVRKYWTGLDAGVGARRNVHLLLSKAFTRAVQDGLIDVSRSSDRESRDRRRVGAMKSFRSLSMRSS